MKVPLFALCKFEGMSEPISEYRFHPTRKWRFDWAWPDAKVALEVQGGIWTKGRHVQAAALIKEHEKLNEAAILGWRIIYCEPKDVATGTILATIKKALNN